ncbi:MAG: hypothetical protein AAGJ28_08930 [Pseudomonadota bacterium]
MLKSAVLRIAVLSIAAVAAACMPRPGLDQSGRGDPARLTYAAPGTQILLLNAVNGQPSESRIQAAAPSGARGAYTTADGRTGSFYPGCWGCGTGMQIEEEKYASLWPLETGKQTVFMRTADDGQKARVVIRVAGLEEVKTNAGTFEAYVLDGRIEHVTGQRYSAQVRAWWAPGPGWVVKAEGGDSRGNTMSSQVAEIISP